MPPKINHQLMTRQLRSLYRNLLNTYGWQKWWLQTTGFEIIVGAILVQNTNWKNVDKSLATLREKMLLSPEALDKITLVELARHIKSSGLYNQKAAYLKNFVHWYLKVGGMIHLKKYKTAFLRSALLNINRKYSSDSGKF